MRRHKLKRKHLKKVIFMALTSFIILFIVFGLITALIKNHFFMRMSPARWYDYFFLITTSLLTGIYISLWYNNNQKNNSCDYAAMGGTLSGMFSFGCALCNQLLVYVLGFYGVVAYFTPIQPILGVVGISILSYAVLKLFGTYKIEAIK